MFYNVELGKLVFCKTSNSKMIDGDYTYFTYISDNYTRKHSDYLHFKVDAENYKYITYDELEPNIKIFAENYLMNLIIEKI